MSIDKICITDLMTLYTYNIFLLIRMRDEEDRGREGGREKGKGTMETQITE